jgi:cytidylate kinase
MTESIPVLAIDGPSGSGKGTVSTTVARQLGWNYLDSGAIYRVLGYLAVRNQIEFDDIQGLVDLAKGLNLEFTEQGIILNGSVVGDKIRTEQAGKHASMVSPIPEVRETLLKWQRSRAVAPGLVADGRDMGTVVFPQACCKIFLTASAQSRAERRYKQLRDKGFDVNISQLFKEISDRDERDTARKASPLKSADDAIVLDTTELSIPEVVSRVLNAVQSRL